MKLTAVWNPSLVNSSDWNKRNDICIDRMKEWNKVQFAVRGHTVWDVLT